MSTDDLAHALADVDDAGLATIEPELRRFVRDSIAHGVSPLLLEIVLDDTEPSVVRRRAFGLAAKRLDGLRHREPSGLLAAA